jgi:hypothetical protein
MNLVCRKLIKSFPSLVSGLSAAHTVYLAGGNIVVLDKQGKQTHNIMRSTPNFGATVVVFFVMHDWSLKSWHDLTSPACGFLCFYTR